MWKSKRGFAFSCSDSLTRGATHDKIRNMKTDEERCIPTAFSVPRGIVTAFRAAAAEGPESASQVIARLMAGWVARKQRRNGAGATDDEVR